MKCSKLAVVSDIHANMAALTTFITYIEKENIEVVLNLGDFISNGPETCEVFDLIMQDKRFVSIRGYDEDSIFNDTRLDEGIGQGRWLKEKLGEKRLEQLRQMKSIRELEVNGKRMLICHHSGWSDIEQLVAHTAEYKSQKYDYIICGGTHLQEYSHSKRYYANTNILDPGTLGAAKDNRAYFAILNFESKEVTVKFHNLEIPTNTSYMVSQKEEKIEDLGQSKEELEESNIAQNAFLYIQGPRQSKDGVMYINDEVINKVIEVGIKNCKYVCIGCWSNEHQNIKEILYHLKCRRVKQSEKENQEWYIGAITDDVVELLLKKRNLPCGRLKWFEISFQNEVEDTIPIYSIFHYGKQSTLKKLTQKELYTMEEMLKKYNLAYTLIENENK